MKPKTVYIRTHFKREGRALCGVQVSHYQPTQFSEKWDDVTCQRCHVRRETVGRELFKKTSSNSES